MVVHIVVAARPNFMKAAPLFHALKGLPWCHPLIIHTGQHYDPTMSNVFFEELGLPKPSVNLGIGSGRHGQQTGRVLEGYESFLIERRPDLVVVCGDVNATPAAALAAVKLGIPVAHLEAGLRSFDRTMPEEINRIITDAICDYLWTPSPDADQNLAREGIPAHRIKRVGNIMIDTLELLRPRIEADPTLERLGLHEQGYAVITLHRPSNVDAPNRLADLCQGMADCSRTLPVVFPVHPRTRARLDTFGLAGMLEGNPRVTITEPYPYCAFMRLVMGSRAVVTDSGGMQEEASYLGIPCLTLRANTERPITLIQGTNKLIEPETLVGEFAAACARPRTPANIDLWDGKTAPRLVECIKQLARID